MKNAQPCSKNRRPYQVLKCVYLYVRFSSVIWMNTRYLPMVKINIGIFGLVFRWCILCLFQLCVQTDINTCKKNYFRYISIHHFSTATWCTYWLWALCQNRKINEGFGKYHFGTSKPVKRNDGDCIRWSLEIWSKHDHPY